MMQKRILNILIAVLVCVCVTYGVSVPTGGDPKAVSWSVVKERWVRNTYANGDITMSDRLTGKMWFYYAKQPKTSGSCEKQTWSDAIAYCKRLTYAGYSDWQLPDKESLQGQFSQQDCFAGDNAEANYFWSRTSALCPGFAWSVNMNFGYPFCYVKPYKCYVWPMRGGR